MSRNAASTALKRLMTEVRPPLPFSPSLNMLRPVSPSPRARSTSSSARQRTTSPCSPRVRPLLPASPPHRSSTRRSRSPSFPPSPLSSSLCNRPRQRGRLLHLVLPHLGSRSVLLPSNSKCASPPLTRSPAEDTPFEGGVFQAELKFPRDYPLSPPKVRPSPLVARTLAAAHLAARPADEVRPAALPPEQCVRLSSSSTSRADSRPSQQSTPTARCASRSSTRPATTPTRTRARASGGARSRASRRSSSRSSACSPVRRRASRIVSSLSDHNERELTRCCAEPNLESGANIDACVRLLPSLACSHARRQPPDALSPPARAENVPRPPRGVRRVDPGPRPPAARPLSVQRARSRRQRSPRRCDGSSASMCEGGGCTRVLYRVRFLVLERARSASRVRKREFLWPRDAVSTCA